MAERGPDDFDDDGDLTPSVQPISPEWHGERRPCLVVVAGAHTGEIFLIDGERVIGRDSSATLRIAEDRGISRRHARVAVRGGAVVVSDLGSSNGTFVNGARLSEPRELGEGDKIRVGEATIFRFVRYDRSEELTQRQLLEEALRDGLTRAFNRSYFMQRLEAEIRFADRHGQPLSLAMLDVDDFKLLNDAHGHQAGDSVLVQVVETITGVLRTEDVMARYGGEEFMLLARNTRLEDGHLLAERVRELIARRGFVHAGSQLRVTVSVGVAGYPMLAADGGGSGGDDLEGAPDRLIALVDAALYRAKRAGKNRVCL
jgi:diguanylate cyclase (GGDEF)-like protein